MSALAPGLQPGSIAVVQQQSILAFIVPGTTQDQEERAVQICLYTLTGSNTRGKWPCSSLAEALRTEGPIPHPGNTSQNRVINFISNFEVIK